MDNRCGIIVSDTTASLGASLAVGVGGIAHHSGGVHGVPRSGVHGGVVGRWVQWSEHLGSRRSWVLLVAARGLVLTSTGLHVPGASSFGPDQGLGSDT